MIIDIFNIRADSNLAESSALTDIKTNCSLIKTDVYEADVCLRGYVQKSDDMFLFNGFIEGNARTICSNCLKEINIPINLQLEQRFSNNKEYVASNDVFEHDILLFSGTKADFTAVATGIINAFFPIAVKCSNTCKGLCQICGGDLNINRCDCMDNNENSVFAELKNLLFHNEEV